MYIATLCRFYTLYSLSQRCSWYTAWCPCGRALGLTYGSTKRSIEKILHRQWRDQQARSSDADCSPNGADLQDTIRNGDVVQVRRRNEFEKRQRRGKGPWWSLRNPSVSSPILTTAVNHTSPLIGLNFLQLRATKLKHACARARDATTKAQNTRRRIERVAFRATNPRFVRIRQASVKSTGT